MANLTTPIETRPPLSRRDRRKLRTREALLIAARSLLGKRSIDALGVDEIAKQADVAKGTFYNYFVDKDAFIIELANSVRAHIEEEIARTNAGVKDPGVRMARALCCVLRLGRDQREEMVAAARLFPRATDPAAPMNTALRQDVTEALSKRRITAASLDAPVALMIGVCMAGANRVIDLEQERAEMFVQDLGTIVLHGLGLRRASAARVMRDAVASVFAIPQEAGGTAAASPTAC